MDAEFEAALLTRLQGGDQGALHKLYTRLSKNVYALALQLLRSPEEAEEVLQDTFLKVYKSARQFDPELGSARAFVYTVARNACLSRLRARRSRSSSPSTATCSKHRSTRATATANWSSGSACR